MEIGKLYELISPFDGRLTNRRGIITKLINNKNSIFWVPSGTIGMFLGAQETNQNISLFLIKDQICLVSNRYQFNNL